MPRAQHQHLQMLVAILPNATTLFLTQASVCKKSFYVPSLLLRGFGFELYVGEMRKLIFGSYFN
jgi:hypothetical protein